MQDQVLMLVSTFQVYSIFSKDNLNKYIYIYMCVCVCVCVCILLLRFSLEKNRTYYKIYTYIYIYIYMRRVQITPGVTLIKLHLFYTIDS